MPVVSLDVCWVQRGYWREVEVCFVMLMLNSCCGVCKTVPSGPKRHHGDTVEREDRIARKIG